VDQRDVSQLALQAAGVAKKGLALKFGVVAGVLFLVGLLLLGMLSPLPSAEAASCEDTGPGTGTAAPDTAAPKPANGGLRAQQIANAQAIDQAAQKLSLSGRATLIALMTAMQESTMMNLAHGHLDSIGLFQQRPSMKWGTKDQIMTPSFAAESFFKGRGGNKGLISIPNWQTRPLGNVAQAVQKSAHPELYAGHENAMKKLAKDAKINLDRTGTAAGGAADDDAAGKDTDPKDKTRAERCGVVTPGTDAGAGGGGTGGAGKGGTFTDGKATWQLKNPRTVTEAIAWANAHSGRNSTADWYQRCLALTAIIYGWGFSGVQYAIDHYKVVPANMRHDKDRNPPPGALMYWDTGHRAGHIAVYLGGGKVVSNDISRPKYVDIVDADAFEKKWRAKYIGWTPPVFPRAG
jgi:hypothetical protein